MKRKQRSDSRHILKNTSEQAATRVAPARTVISSGGNQSVARALAILDLIGGSGELGVRDVARKLGFAASIAQRLISTLAQAGFVEQSPTTQRYRIGHKAYRVGQAYLAASDLLNACLPELQMLSDLHELNSFLGVLQNRAVVYLAAVQSNGPITIRNVPGTVAPIHSTAFGKALLFDRDDKSALEMLGPPPYRKLTGATITTARGFLADLRRSRQRGYAICDAENLDGVYAIGVPIRDAMGQIIAALSVALPSQQLPADGEAKLARIAQASAERISRRLGAAPSSHIDQR